MRRHPLIVMSEHSTSRTPPGTPDRRAATAHITTLDGWSAIPTTPYRCLLCRSSMTPGLARSMRSAERRTMTPRARRSPQPPSPRERRGRTATATPTPKMGAAAALALANDAQQDVACHVGVHRREPAVVGPVPPGVLERKLNAHLRAVEPADVEGDEPERESLAHGGLLGGLGHRIGHNHQHRPGERPNTGGSPPPRTTSASCPSPSTARGESSRPQREHRPSRLGHPRG